MAMAERAFIMTVPCHWAFVALHLMGRLIPSARFRMSSRKEETVSSAGVLCRPSPEDETLPARIGDAATPKVVRRLWNNKPAGRGTGPACGAAGAR